MSQIFAFLGGSSTSKADQLKEPLFSEAESGYPPDHRMNDSFTPDSACFDGGEDDNQVQTKIKRQMTSDAAEKMKASLGKSLIKQVGDYISDFNKIVDRYEKESDFYIFEPKGFGQKLEAIRQNMIESVSIVGVMIAGLSNPSTSSFLQICVTIPLMFTSVMEPFSRIKYGIVSQMISIALMLTCVIYKILFLFKFENAPVNQPFGHEFKAPANFTAQENQHAKMMMNQSQRSAQRLGFLMSLRNQTNQELTGDYVIEFNYVHSFMFEIVCIPILLFGIVMLWRSKKKFNEMKKNKRLVFAVKNFEDDDLNDEEADESTKTMNIGSSKEAREEKALKEQQHIDKQNYIVEMSGHAKKIYRNYLDCKWFERLNKICYIILIIGQITQAMTFNGIIMVPVMIIILLLQSIYQFRKIYGIAVTALTFFTVYFMQFICFVKILHMVIVRIPFIAYKLQHNMEPNFRNRVEEMEAFFGKFITGDLNQYGFIFNVIVCFMCAQAWKQQKWAHVREFENDMPANSTFYQVFSTYIKKLREIKNNEDTIKQYLEIHGSKKKSNSVIQAKRDLKKIAKNKDGISKLKVSVDVYFPLILMWAQRILFGLQIFMYHKSISLFHVCWFLGSFMMSGQKCFFISLVVMIPCYSAEFFFVYGSQIKKFTETVFFKTYGTYFEWTMKQPALEQLLYYAILSNFCMMYSAFYHTISVDPNKQFVERFHARIYSPNSSPLWNFVFYIFKYSHSIVLLGLFINGRKNIDEFHSLGFILLLVIYTSYVSIYRRTSWILTIFTSFFIFGNYYFSLRYMTFVKDKNIMFRMLWLGLFKCEYYTQTAVQDPNVTAESLQQKCAKTYPDLFDERPNESIYFAHTPDTFDLFILIIMSALNTINHLFKDEEKAAKLERKVYENLRNKYPYTVFAILRVQNFNAIWLPKFVLFIMIIFLKQTQTNFITWVFAMFNINLIVMIIRGGYKEEVHKKLVFLTSAIKEWATFVIIVDILFICFIGEDPKLNQPQSLDQNFAASFPKIYKYLDFIGLRLIADPFHPFTNEDKRQMYQNKFTSYIIYLVSSIYLNSFFHRKLRESQAEKSFEEKDYKGLFEFQETPVLDIKSDDESNDGSGSKKVGDKSSSDETLKYADTKFVQKARYDKYDLLDRYEFRRYNTAFIVYKWMDWWSTFDTLANYGHIVGNLMIVYVAVHISVSIFMAFNIVCCCFYYLTATHRLHIRAMKNYRLSGLLGQTDLNIANIVTKQFKIGAFYEFLKVRSRIWEIQVTALLIFASLGYPTSLIEKVRNNFVYDLQTAPEQHPHNAEYIRSLTKAQYWCFVLGNYKDHRPEAEKYFYYTYGLLIAGLFVEKLAINWLTNRWGCTYNKLQKFIELDLRQEAIASLDDPSKEKWEVVPPAYSTARYELHYFYHNFRQLQERFTETEEQEAINEKAFYESAYNKEIRSFVPYKVALRMRAVITFSVKLDGRAPELRIGESTKAKLLKMEDGWEKWNRESAALSVKEHALFGSTTIVQIKDQWRLFQEIRSQRERGGDENLREMTKCKKKAAKRGEEVEEFIDWKACEDLFAEKSEVDQQQTQLEDEYESIPILKLFKTQSLQLILEEAVNRKYKISFFKGMQLVIENAVLLVLMLSVILKSNLFALIYLMFIIKYLFSPAKQHLLVKLTIYLAVCLTAQYALFLLNLTAEISPAPFPASLSGYPDTDPAEPYNIEMPLPLFFRFKIFRDLRLCYLLGIGVAEAQLQTLFMDFLNMYLVTCYIMNFRNPLLVKSMKKVFWQFPTNMDSKEQWKRLDDDVRRQVLWQQHPLRITDDRYKEIKEEKYSSGAGLFNRRQTVKHAEDEYDFQERFTNEGLNLKIDLNETMVTYIDLKYNHIWSNDFMKKIKWQFKEINVYFRLVKQGSILVYLAFHIVTIMMVLLMAVLRRSFLSFVYVLIVLPNLKSFAQVLRQNIFAQDKESIELTEKVEQEKEQIDRLDQEFEDARAAAENDMNSRIEAKYGNGDLKPEQENERKREEQSMKVKFDEDMADLEKQKLVDQQEFKDRVQRHLKALRILNLQKVSQKTFEQRQDEKVNSKETSWNVVPIIQKYLLAFAIADYCCQVLIQLPLFPASQWAGYIGLRKIFHDPHPSTEAAFNYDNLIKVGLPYDEIRFEWHDFTIEILNCFMICMISLQSQIFDSAGYQKFCTQKDGSMDLLVNLSYLKAKSMAYTYNNYKIRKIMAVQKRKEIILNTVEKVRDKLKRWRQFTRTTLDVEAENRKKVEEAQRLLEEETKTLQSQRRGTLAPPGKKVTMDLKEETHDAVGDEESDHDHAVVEDLVAEIKREEKISVDDSRIIQKKLATEFVKEKKKKLNCCTQVYFMLNNNFVEKILFKNKQEEIDKLLEEQLKGAVEIPCELEVIMMDEAMQLIEERYDHLDGSRELHTLLLELNQGKGKSIIRKTNLGRAIKLAQMQRTWAFTRTGSILMKVLETLFYILISNTHNLIYLSMIYSMFQNSGIISLIYPMMIFGYALLEETRPDRRFWDFCRVYTIILLSAKFTMNLSVWGPFLQSPSVQAVFGWLKPGFQNHATAGRLCIYMLPEILISCLLMLNEIQLRMLGLYYQREDDIETIQDGISRNLEQGDAEAVRRKKVQKANMDLAANFRPKEEQQADIEEYERQTREEEEREHARVNLGMKRRSKGQDPKVEEAEAVTEQTELEKQREAFAAVVNDVVACSRNFDLDDASNKKDSLFDQMVQELEIQKSLENDHIIYMEGRAQAQRADATDASVFLTTAEIDDDYHARLTEMNFSAGDVEEEFDAAFQDIDARDSPRLGVFEQLAYFDKIFPSLKIQKPGYDLYGSTTCVLGILCLYVFFLYGQMSIDQANYLGKAATDNAGLFKGNMVLCLVSLILLIIIERYVNRTDTKAEKETRISAEKAESFFKKDEMFQRASTARSMTIKLKTMRTTDLDIGDSVAQNFLSAMYGDEASAGQNDDTRTKITAQQKCKYTMHISILVFVHLFVFWFIPIQGNMQLYGSPNCGQGDVADYGCKDFHTNGFLQGFYVLSILYLLLSALQLKYGFPIMKKPSSVMQYNNTSENPVPLILANVYYAIPFMVELRCLIDFTLSKTSLDIFQFWQLFQYHFDMYTAKGNNIWYNEKQLGIPQYFFPDKIFAGWLIGVGLLAIIIGPLWFFSTVGGFVAPNPVTAGSLKVSLVIKKSLDAEELAVMTGGRNATAAIEVDSNSLNVQSLEETNLLEAGSGAQLNQTVPYDIYWDRDPLTRTYDEKIFHDSPYRKWTETRFFAPAQIQDTVFSEFAQWNWIVSEDNRRIMNVDIARAMNLTDNQYSLELQTEVSYTRKLPATAKQASLTQTKTLNGTWLPDCLTRQQLLQLSKFSCPNNTSGIPDGAEKPLSISVRFSEAFNPLVILGYSDAGDALYREGVTHGNQKKDLLLEFTCPHQWQVREALHYNNFTADQEAYLLNGVDQETCKAPESAGALALWEDKETRAAALDREYRTRENAGVTWDRVRFTVFSMVVSASFFAAYNITTFYTGVTVLAGGAVRLAFLMNSYKQWVYETTHPESIIKVVEACYLYRHEENLQLEEECYRMLQEIFRQPDFIKTITGSSLKGSCDPIYDKFDEEDRKKMENIEQLESKGFEVKGIKDGLLEKYQDD